jgi:polar amino acid transport system permease protein
MSYTFQFGALAQYQNELLSGIWLTIKLSVLSIVLGCAFGILLASLRSINGGIVRIIVDAYVEVIRNTPFLVQLFIVYFGLPGLGFRVGADTAALIGMTINLAAYSTEIIRAGIEAVHKSQIEAGEALGFTKYQIYRHVIMVPAIAKVYPSLCSQFVLMMLASSICSPMNSRPPQPSWNRRPIAPSRSISSSRSSILRWRSACGSSLPLSACGCSAAAWRARR